ncbi:MAG: sn-glycerol-3-phosphate ABC transporter ATP-binding protein UgpC [candidate division WS1 bacterium]|jgi:multiple sugar transport system ATP-binding protein|nr:sn-glycerol-3-phosphate ABC transporter ATP-binding protein UgpC [candidate division WS1 bacterium]
MAQVRLTGLSKRFGQTEAVRSVDLEVQDHEFLVLVGPSGCGKTTALRMIAGLEEPTSGDIYIGDRRVNELSPKDRDIAMVFQNYALYPHMTVYDNMAFSLRLSKLPREEIGRRVQEAAEMLGIAELLERKPGQLSGGQRQRVAVGRAVVREPAVFLMDEPLSNLDAKLRIQTRAELIKLHRRLGITTVYVTHDQVEAMTMGDRIVVMRHGEVQQCDTPQEIFDHPANRFVAGFIGSPPMNFIDAQLKADGEAVIVAAEELQVTLPPEMAENEAVREYLGRPIVFGIRPTDIHDASLPGPVSPEPGNTVQTQVEVVEPMGAESMVYLTAGSHSLVASLDSATCANEGQPLKVSLNMPRTHLFDAETGKTIV